jgi:hypothetical protein
MIVPSKENAATTGGSNSGIEKYDIQSTLFDRNRMLYAPYDSILLAKVL